MATTDQPELPEPGIDDDRLSCLPDEVLSHILFFLETKYAVGTSGLSRRWRDLWTGVPALDLDSSLVYRQRQGRHPAPDEAQRHPRTRKIRSLEVSRIFDRVLSQHRNLNSLKRLRVRYSETHCESSPNFWSRLKLVPGSRLEEIDVRVLRREAAFPMHFVPESFYTLKNLKALELVSVVMVTQGSVFLPSVKILGLFGVETKDCESLNRFLSGCPVLESAQLVECYYSSNMNVKPIPVAASLPSLKNLTVIGHGYSDVMQCPIVIEAPSLQHLECQNFELKTLLSSASELQTLLVIRLINGRGRRMEWKESPGCTPRCLLSSLEQIDIHNLSPVDGINMVAYLLNVGAVLKKVNLHLVGVSREMVEERFMSILKLPRGSSACEASFFYYGAEVYIGSDDKTDAGDSNT